VINRHSRGNPGSLGWGVDLGTSAQLQAAQQKGTRLKDRKKSSGACRETDESLLTGKVQPERVALRLRTARRGVSVKTRPPARAVCRVHGARTGAGQRLASERAVARRQISGRVVRRGWLARDKGGEWAAADASRGSAMAVAYLRAGGYWCQAGGEPLVRRARAHLRGDDCSRLAAAHGMGGEVAGHARAKANTRERQTFLTCNNQEVD